MVRGGRGSHVDGHQCVPDDVVELVGQSEALLVEAVLRGRFAGVRSFLGERALERLAGAQCLAREQGAQHQRDVGNDVRGAGSLASDEHGSGDDQRH